MRDETGFTLLPGRLSPDDQARLVADIMQAAREAPFHVQATPGGKPMSVETTGLGPLSWVSDRLGYRYEPRHPLTGQPWPPMPPLLQALWADLVDPVVPADAGLVNLYRPGARMGLHRDEDEADFAFPVLSISLGDTALFRIGGLTRKGPTRSLRLASGDVCLLAGQSRLAYHGVDRIIPGSSRLVPGGGRINITLRRAAPPPALAAPVPSR
ncbi:MAG: alpha-ketoglutarate-dependent dioxygenase AlkB [Caulobacter sp.]|nr:alpha-ketoglutarate-dependent dioxygenase AlkB [Caulobacter sp.]